VDLLPGAEEARGRDREVEHDVLELDRFVP